MIEKVPDQRIRAYLRGQLSTAEKEEFEKKLALDAELRVETELQKAEMASLELLIASETRGFFREWKSESKAQPSLFWHRPQMAWAMAAGLALICMAVLFFQKNEVQSRLATPSPRTSPETEMQKPEVEKPQLPENQPIEPQEKIQALPKEDFKLNTQPLKSFGGNAHARIAKSFFVEPPLANIRSTVSADSANFLSRAKTAYKAGDFRETLLWLEKVDSARQQSADFLAANALFHLERYAEAENHFQKLVVAQSRQYKFQSEWGALLCRLARFPPPEKTFRARLNAVLANPNHPFFEKAKELASMTNGK